MKVAIYCHDTFGLGHISRAMKISRIIQKEKKTSIYIVTGSGGTAIFTPPYGVDFVKLPTLSRIYNQKTPYQAAVAHLNPSTVIDMRKAILLSFFRTFNPNIVIVDHSPKGIMGELEPSLEFLTQRKRKLFFITRDILDDPRTVIRKWTKNGNYETLKKYYHQIIIAGDPKYYDAITHYHLKQTNIPCAYGGYMITPKKETRKKTDILVSFGGGRDGSSIILDILSVIKKSGLTKNHTFHIILGPLFSPETARRLQREKTNGIEILDWTPHAESPSDCCLRITMGGYNTFCESLSSLTPTIIIPREDVEKEQLIRARLFQKEGAVALVRQKDILKSLFPTIKRILDPAATQKMVRIQKKIVKSNTNHLKELIFD
jgi:predicted glycosyltransferase